MSLDVCNSSGSLCMCLWTFVCSYVLNLGTGAGREDPLERNLQLGLVLVHGVMMWFGQQENPEGTTKEGGAEGTRKKRDHRREERVPPFLSSQPISFISRCHQNLISAFQHSHAGCRHFMIFDLFYYGFAASDRFAPQRPSSSFSDSICRNCAARATSSRVVSVLLSPPIRLLLLPPPSTNVPPCHCASTAISSRSS